MDRVLLSFLVIILALFGLQSIDRTEGNCVNLYIDYGQLDNGKKINECIEISDKTTALDILQKTEIEIEGTKRYGLDVLCRINGLPNIKMESCDTMPSESAYWAIIVKERQVLPFPRKEWGWSQFGITQQYLDKGDSIGFVFTENGKVRFP